MLFVAGTVLWMGRKKKEFGKQKFKNAQGTRQRIKKKGTTGTMGVNLQKRPVEHEGDPKIYGSREKKGRTGQKKKDTAAENEVNCKRFGNLHGDPWQRANKVDMGALLEKSMMGDYDQKTYQ